VRFKRDTRKQGSKEAGKNRRLAQIDRIKTRQGQFLFLKADVGGEMVRVFGRLKELVERLEASGYDIPASEIEDGTELLFSWRSGPARGNLVARALYVRAIFPCLVKVGKGGNGYRTIKEFLSIAAGRSEAAE